MFGNNNNNRFATLSLPAPIRVELPTFPTLTKLNNTNDISTATTSLYQNGFKYTGQYKNGLPEGNGTLYFPTSDLNLTIFWEGEFQAGKPCGAGRFENKITGVKFRGRLENEVITGYGEYEWDGNTYTGAFQNNQAHGKGKWEMFSDDVLQGFFENGRAHGKCTLTYDNGDCFEGNYLHGNPSGKGKMLFAAQKIVMNRSFNNTGIDRTSTRELKDNTFEIKKRSKSTVKVHHGVFKHQKKSGNRGRNPNAGVIGNILGNLGISSKKSTRRATRKSTKKSTLQKSLRNASKKARVGPKLIKVTTKKAKRKPRGPNKPFDESYLDYHRTQIYKRSTRTRGPINTTALFSENIPIRRTRSALKSWKMAQRLLTQGTVNQLEEAEMADDEMSEEENIQNQNLNQMVGIALVLPTISEVTNDVNDGDKMAAETPIANTQDASQSQNNAQLTQLMTINDNLNKSIAMVPKNKGFATLKRTISDIAASICK